LLNTLTGTVNELSPIVKLGNATTPSLSSAPSAEASADDCCSNSPSGTDVPR